MLNKKWLRGTVVDVSDKICMIKGDNGSSVSKHIDHVVLSTSEGKVTELSPKPASDNAPNPAENCGEPPGTGRSSVLIDSQIARPKQLSTQLDLDTLSIDNHKSDTQSSDGPALNTRPKRLSKPVERLTYEVLGGN